MKKADFEEFSSTLNIRFNQQAEVNKRLEETCLRLENQIQNASDQAKKHLEEELRKRDAESLERERKLAEKFDLKLTYKAENLELGAKADVVDVELMRTSINQIGATMDRHIPGLQQHEHDFEQLWQMKAQLQEEFDEKVDSLKKSYMSEMEELLQNFENSVPGALLQRPSLRPRSGKEAAVQLRTFVEESATQIAESNPYVLAEAEIQAEMENNPQAEKRKTLKEELAEMEETFRLQMAQAQADRDAMQESQRMQNEKMEKIQNEMAINNDFLDILRDREKRGYNIEEMHKDLVKVNEQLQDQVTPTLSLLQRDNKEAKKKNGELQERLDALKEEHDHSSSDLQERLQSLRERNDSKLSQLSTSCQQLEFKKVDEEKLKSLLMEKADIEQLEMKLNRAAAENLINQLNGQLGTKLERLISEEETEMRKELETMQEKLKEEILTKADKQEISRLQKAISLKTKDLEGKKSSSSSAVTTRSGHNHQQGNICLACDQEVQNLSSANVILPSERPRGASPPRNKSPPLDDRRDYEGVFYTAGFPHQSTIPIKAKGAMRSKGATMTSSGIRFWQGSPARNSRSPAYSAGPRRSQAGVDAHKSSPLPSPAGNPFIDLSGISRESREASSAFENESEDEAGPLTPLPNGFTTAVGSHGVQDEVIGPDGTTYKGRVYNFSDDQSNQIREDKQMVRPKTRG